MRIDGITIRRLHINDASLLKEAGVFSGSRASIENIIRKFISDSSYLAYMLEKDGVSQAFALLSPFGLSKDSYILDFYRSEDCPCKDVLDKVLYHVLIKKQIHKVSLVIRVDDKVLEEAALSLGMIQDAVLVDEISLGNNKFVDAGLFYITLSEFRGYNVGFVAFQRGVVCVYGTEDYVDRLMVYHYGDAPTDYLTVKVASRLELLDDDNKFIPKNSSNYYDLDNSFLPQEVEKAVDELGEYFRKDRDEFDINIRFNDCTDFQESVWNALRSVPYGATLSYEDIARKISSSKEEAKKLTRAVGAACADNPIPILVPCHRVIGKDGKLVGYSLGLDIKDFLLQHESVFMTLL